MRPLLFLLPPLISSCILSVPVEGKLCDDDRACIDGFECIDNRCLLLGSAEGEGEGGEGEEGEEGEGEGSEGEGEEGEGGEGEEGQGEGGEGEGEGGEGEGEGGEGEGGEGEGGEGEGEGEGETHGTCVAPLTLTLGSRDGDTTAGGDDAQGSCAGTNALDDVYAFTAPENGTLHLVLHSDSDQGIHVRFTCDDAESENSCTDAFDGGTDEVLDVALETDDAVFVYIDGFDGPEDAGAYVLDATYTAAICGNDVIEGGEACDGASVDADCGELNLVDGTLACNGDCLDFDTSACLPPICGNGALEPTEACDGADFGDATTCAELDENFTGGALLCFGDCDLNAGNCTSSGTCDHDSCTIGNTLDASVCADACISEICGADPFCCTVEWDDICVAQVSTVCGQAC